MAQTTRALAVYYGCFCSVMAVMQFHAPGMVAAAAVMSGGGGGGGGDDGQRRTARVLANDGGGGGHGTPAFDGTVNGQAARSRNKRWSTTFGGSSTVKNATYNIVRDCTTDSDCLETQFTSCAIDPSDKKRRCLCADAKQPVNGDCLKKPRALRVSCELDLECLPNAVCLSNATASNKRLKICMCKEGFVEENDMCNYADLVTFNRAVLLIAVLSSWIWNDSSA